MYFMKHSRNINKLFSCRSMIHMTRQRLTCNCRHVDFNVLVQVFEKILIIKCFLATILQKSANHMPGVSMLSAVTQQNDASLPFGNKRS